MAREKTRPRKETARQKLDRSRLQLTQREMMGDDVDLEDFILRMKGATNIQTIESIIDADIERTIEGASTLTVTITDPDNTLVKSGRLHWRNDVRLDGLWFRLVKVEKQGPNITLVWEDREVAVLRTYVKPIIQSQKTNRNKVTRAEFALRLIREVKEFKIPYVIPELHKKQPIEKTADVPAKDTKKHQRNKGIPVNAGVTVKGAQMKEFQRNNANIILDVGTSHSYNRSYLVMAIMCAIQESTLTNLPQPKPGDFNYLGINPATNPVGVFQQRKLFGWPATRDVAKDAAAFYRALISVWKPGQPTPYASAIEAVQKSGNPRAYGVWHTEAERIVTAYGEGGRGSTDLQKAWQDTGGGQDNTYEFYRGVQPTGGQKKWGRENSWTCLNRLAEEVNWRCFFVSGTFYFISEPELFKAEPRMVISPEHEAVEDIDFDYDVGQKWAQVVVTARIGRWAAPPGSVVLIKDMGMINGRWLVSNVKRGIFDKQGTITLTKPHPKLPEPGGGNIDQNASENQDWKLKDDQQTGGAQQASDKAKKALAYAMKQIGDPYKWGAEGPNQFDCSGLTMAAYATVGIKLPHNAELQWRHGKQMHSRTTDPLARKAPPFLPGDLVFFGKPSGGDNPQGLHHVGMVVEGTTMVDAPHSGARVRKEDFTTWPDYFGFTRPTLA